MQRRGKEKIPVLAICYDFDKTLSPDDMQARVIFKRSDTMCLIFGENPTIWQTTMKWIKIWPICSL